MNKRVGGLPTLLFETLFPLMQKLSYSYQVMLLIAIVLAVFYPTQFADICLIDDQQTLISVFNSNQPPLLEMFFPRSSAAGYYRPLIGISFWLDKSLWFLEERLLHFENVVAHLANVILVFYICRVIVSNYPKPTFSALPFVAALVFAVHPLVTESVNWISGRTDVMMGTFVLISVLCILVYKKCGSRLMLAASLVALLLSLLAKEAAFGYLLCLPLFLFKIFSKDSNSQISYKREVILFCSYYVIASSAALFLGSYWLVLVVGGVYLLHLIIFEKIVPDGIALLCKNIWILAGFLLTSVCLFFLFRRLAFSSSVAKIGQTFTLMCADINYTISLFLGAYGFYLKKTLLPLPLNFYIHEIDPLYDFFGIAVFLITLRLLLSGSLASIMALAGIALLLPALPFAFGTIAWNSYAERYLYLPIAFWSVAFCLWGSGWLAKNDEYKKTTSIVVAVLLLIMSLITFQRNIVWQSNVTLFRDTLSQNPSSPIIRGLYLEALGRAGYIEEAKREYLTLKTKNGAIDISLELKISSFLVETGRYREAFKIIKSAYYSQTNHSDVHLLSFEQLLNRLKEKNTEDVGEQAEYDTLAHEITSILQKSTKSPEHLFRFGKSALKRGSFDEAVTYFDRALEQITSDNRLYPLAIRLRNQANSHDL